MNPSKYNLNKIHFIGIGGSGMSGIAEVLFNLGYKITGSDQTQSSNTSRLENLGIEIQYQHKPSNLMNVEMVVKSSAIRQDNPELLEAKNKSIPILARAEMLSSLMNNKRGIAIAGTHGKTTTTSLIASIMTTAGLDPTFINGGIINSFNSNAQLGSGDYLITEADESDQSFLLLQPSISVITNIEPDHLVNYDYSFENLKIAFLDFIKNLPFNGLSIVCGDDEVIRSLRKKFQRAHISYGFYLDNDFVISDYKCDGSKSFFSLTHDNECQEFELNMIGKHNVLNATAAIILCLQEGINIKVIQDSLSNFMGLDRRMQILGKKEINNNNCVFIDDYGHHPTEIEQTIDALRDAYSDHKLNMVFQPHRYTRTQDLLDEFVKVLQCVDKLYLLDIYSAGEEHIEGISSESLMKVIIQSGFNSVEICPPSFDFQKLLQEINSKTVFVFQGAGNISSISKKIQEEYL